MERWVEQEQRRQRREKAQVLRRRLGAVEDAFAGRSPMARRGPFGNRAEAGRTLVSMLRRYLGDPRILVLGIARGGVPVAFEIATALGARLDVLVVRKLGLPEQPELAIGAIASGGVRVLNAQLIRELGISERVLDGVARLQLRELERRESLYRSGRIPADPQGCDVILVDDGLATGATMRAAIAALRRRGAARIIVAVPVADRRVGRAISELSDEFVCPVVTDALLAVGEWYRDFSPTSDAEVVQLLQRAPGGQATAA